MAGEASLPRICSSASSAAAARRAYRRRRRDALVAAGLHALVLLPDGIDEAA